MSKIKNGGLDQYHALSLILNSMKYLNSSKFEQLAFKGLNTFYMAVPREVELLLKLEE